MQYVWKFMFALCRAILLYKVLS